MGWNWDTPPGAPSESFVRALVKKAIAGFVVGAVSLGAAWAGVSLAPVNQDNGPETPSVDRPGTVSERSREEAVSESTTGDSDEVTTAVSLSDPAPGQILAGAAKVSIEPRPEDYGGTWETENCKTLGEDAPHGATHVADFRVRWLENSNCIYMGGYGIGPMFPITSWSDPYGLWVRSIAMSDGEDVLVLTLLDGVYWEAKYNSLCDGCGFFDLQQWAANEFGVPADSFMFASTHSHTAPDFIGGWGGVPRWYMNQVTDSFKASVTAAMESLRPAILETGETIVRARNAERRDFYRSAEEDSFAWFRLIDAADQPRPEVCTTPTPTPDPGNNGNGNGNGYGNEGREPDPDPTPVCDPGSPGKAIATVGAYAAHPVTADADSGVADADFPAVFAAEVEQAYGGIGAFFQTGLGNMSPRGDKVEMGRDLAGYVGPMGSGTVVAEADVRVKQAHWNQPVTNSVLGALGVAGFFDRTFNQTPAEVRAGKSAERPCTSASPISVRTAVTAAKVGSLWITGGPGELFSNLTNTIKERNPGGVTMPLGLVNDGLGYIIQSFETDHLGRQGTGFVGDPLAEYEDAYSIDHCFGDKVLETTIGLLGGL